VVGGLSSAWRPQWGSYPGGVGLGVRWRAVLIVAPAARAVFSSVDSRVLRQSFERARPLGFTERRCLGSVLSLALAVRAIYRIPGHEMISMGNSEAALEFY
jgi:hypothetical protein